MSSQARADFAELMQSVQDLIEIHGQAQEGRGRRHGKESIHRAGVVLTVAAWQAYVEKLALESLGEIEAQITQVNVQNPPPPWAIGSFYFRKPAITQAVGALNTPNSQNVIKLFETSFGLNPKINWAWNAPHRNWTSQEFCNRTDQWLRIRHTIAHGEKLPENLLWLKNNAGNPRLNLNLLK